MADLYAALVSELRTDPLKRDYAAMSDDQRFDSLTTVNRKRLRRVSSLDLLLWGGSNGRLARVSRAAQKGGEYANLSDEMHSAATVANAMIVRSDAGFDPRIPAHMQLIGALQLIGVLKQEDVDSLMQLAQEDCSRASELGMDGLGIGHLTTAREMMGG